MCPLIVASDVGGTFTDTVTIDEGGSVWRYKSPTVPHDPALGVVATLELAAPDLGTDLDGVISRIGLFAHGTTVATNAMLEGKRSKFGLLQTRGFGDTLSVMSPSIWLTSGYSPAPSFLAPFDTTLTPLGAQYGATQGK